MCSCACLGDFIYIYKVLFSNFYTLISVLFLFNYGTYVYVYFIIIRQLLDSVPNDVTLSKQVWP